jgi:hypothetical protein
MNQRLAQLLITAYPRWWRRRYGNEFEVLLLGEPGGLRNLLDVALSAVRERIISPNGPDEPPLHFGLIATRPSAFLPVAMSLAALSAVIFHALIYGLTRQADEGAVAHIWQILMAGQLPLLALFAIKWLPRSPGYSLCVLATQAGAALASIAPVYLLKL